MKTFKGKDYEKEREKLLETVRDYRTQRNECRVNLDKCTEDLQSELSVLQNLTAQVSADVDDVPTIERNIDDCKTRIKKLDF